MKKISDPWFGKNKQIRAADSLYINMRKSNKTFICRKTIRGKQTVITIGQHPQVTLKQAKAKVTECFKLDNPTSLTSVPHAKNC